MQKIRNTELSGTAKMCSKRYYEKFADGDKANITQELRHACQKDLSKLLEKIQKVKKQNAGMKELVVEGRKKMAERQTSNLAGDTSEDEMSEVQRAKIPAVTEALSAFRALRLRIDGRHCLSSKKRPTSQDSHRQLRDKHARRGSPTF